ncbi:MAG: hypothetical protein AB1505_22075 [Candidatus Latescibacterota bacterium]
MSTPGADRDPQEAVRVHAQEMAELRVVYDNDGLHLEFCRAVPFFAADERDKMAHMTAFVRQLRQGLDRIGRERHRHLRLSIWFIPTPELMQSGRPAGFALEHMYLPSRQGMDPQVWVEERLVDLLIPAIGTGDRDVEPAYLGPWVGLARGSGRQVYGSVSNATARPQPALLRRVCELVRSIGAQADGVFLFNTLPADLAAVLEAGPTGPRWCEGKSHEP